MVAKGRPDLFGTDGEALPEDGQVQPVGAEQRQEAGVEDAGAVLRVGGEWVARCAPSDL